MRTADFLLALLLGLGLTACNPTLKSPDEINQARQSIQGSWTLEKADGLPDLPANILLTLRADTGGNHDKLAVSGFSGVNHFVGTASVDWSQQRLGFGPLAGTRMMGPEPRMQFEQAFLNRLGQVVGFRHDNDKLVLKTLSGDSLDFRQGPQ